VARIRVLLTPRRSVEAEGTIVRLDDDVRCAAAFALGRIGTDAGRAVLLASLEEGDALAGGGAALALGRLGDPAARAALREAITADRPIPTRALAIVALARLRDERLAETVTEMLEMEPELLRTNLGGVAIASLGPAGATDVRDLLERVLLDEKVPDENRAAAAATMGVLGLRGSISALDTVLSATKDPFLRAHVVLALARIGAPSAPDAVTENLEKGRLAALRRLTMDAVAFVGGDDAVARLTVGMADVYQVNREAVRALTRVDRAAALTAVMARHGVQTDVQTRRYAVDMLGFMVSERQPTTDVVRDLHPLAAMPLSAGLLWLGPEAYLYELIRSL
jgi:HEAT repeat protein